MNATRVDRDPIPLLSSPLNPLTLSFPFNAPLPILSVHYLAHERYPCGPGPAAVLHGPLRDLREPEPRPRGMLSLPH